MKRLKSHLFNILISILVIGCKADPGKSVEALVKGFLEPVSIESSMGPELGEIITTDDSSEIIIKITNNSSDEIKNITYDFDTSENIFDYKPNLDGLSFYPGAGGTCGSSLASKKSCIIKMALTPRKQGDFTIAGKISYLNRVEPQSKDLNYHLVSGQPASITFTNEISNYALGTFEQTEPYERFLEFEVQNNGGLPARDLNVYVNNDDIAGAYSLVEHNCPKRLWMKEKCKVKVSYISKNNNYTDPETIYTGQIKFDYLKDPSDNSASLNGYLSFTSATIEAKFKTNYAQADFGTVVTGNKEIRMVKLTNMGYREGILQELTLKKSNGTVAATCVKGTGTVLNCSKTLYEFPFVIEDTNSCFGNEVASYLAPSGSPNCVFKITYWPSVDFLAGSQSSNNFNNSTISFTYDSKWKGTTNIVTKDNVFNLLATFLAKAKLTISKIELNTVALSGTDLTTINNVTNANLGRLAKIATGYSSVYYPVKIYFRNSGEVEASFLKLDDGKPTPNTIIDLNETVPGVAISRDYNDYYKGVKQESCLTIVSGGECNISFNLSPVKKSTQALEDASMYDDITNAFYKFKTFNFYYTDGSKFNDDGGDVTSRNHLVHLSSLLVAKGKLILSPATTLSMGSSIISGTSSVKSLIVKNIGTGKIAALQYMSGKTLEVPSAGTTGSPSGAATGIPAYPYRISKFADHSESLPPGADYDCYDLIYGAATTFPFAADSSKILDEGKNCALRIEAKLPLNSSTLTSSVTTGEDYKRFWASGVSSTNDAWMPQTASIPTVTPRINYWDGDDNSINDAVSTPYFGYKGVSDTLNITSSWSKPAMMGIQKIEPIASSVLFKPEITYPEINETFPSKTKLNSTTAPSIILSNYEMILGNSVSIVALRSTAIKKYYTSFDSSYYGSSVNTPYVYVGAIKKSTDFYTQVNIANFGNETPSEVQLADAGGDAGFTLAKFQTLVGSNVYNPLTSGTGNLNLYFKINIATAGQYQHCYDVNYKGEMGTRNYKFCVTAIILDNFPNIAIQYKNNDVTWNATTSTFDVTPDASFTTLNAPYNKLSTCDNYYSCSTPSAASELLSFSTVSSTAASCISAKNCQYDKKTVKITNNGTSTIRDFKIDISKFPSANYASTTLLYQMNATECSDVANSYANIQNKIAVCQSEITACNNLAVGASCTLNFYYTPTATVTAVSDSMIVISYIGDDRNSLVSGAYSYVNHYLPIKYEGLASASPIAYEYMRKGVDGVSDGSIPATATTKQTISGSTIISNWSDPTAPVTSEASSYPLKLGTYAINYGSSTIVNSNYLIDSSPKTMTIYVNVKNTSSSRVSFLRANPSPSTATWNQIYPEWDYNTSAFKVYSSLAGSSKTKIYATEGCFYGEVKDDAGVPSNTKGFNSATESSSTKKCQLRVDFSGDITYSSCNATTKTKTTSFGGDIDLNCNPYVYKIPFWSFKRSTSLFFKLHLTEFIEPARSAYSGNVTNIATSVISGTNAKLTLTLPAVINETVSSLGTISKYRILWAKDAASLRSSDIFKKSPPTTNFCYIDTTDATLPKTVSLSACSNSALNIATGKYWYVKIMTVRTMSSSHPNYADIGTFISDPKIPVIITATPNNANLTYVDALKSFVDNTLIDMSNTYSYTNAVAKCASTTNNIIIANGATNVSNPKKLIDFNVWNYIRTGIVPSTVGQGYTAMGPGYLPHWLGDAAVAINSSAVKLYDGTTLTGGFPGFNSSTIASSNNYYKISYNKGCTTATCNNLSVVVGGDNDSTFAEGVFYTYVSNKAAFARCYVPIICPTNTGVALSNAACFLKY